jgi:hypothetical protein
VPLRDGVKDTMRRLRVLVFLAGAAVVWSAGPLAVPGTAGAWAVAGGSRGRAIEVPGLAALNTGGSARVDSVSCASTGNCAATGHYTDRHGQQGFVADERNGRWGQAIGVPGLAALNNSFADVVSVSCASAGNCATGGYYANDSTGFRFSAFVATERGSRWGKAITLPTGDGEVDSVSCVSGGDCLAGGDGASCYCSNHHAFIVKEQARRWGALRPVPGLWALGHSNSWISSVACPSAGNCTVGGGYADDSGNQHGFVATEQNGAWGTATEVPGLAALNTGENANVVSVSCASAGNCAAGGYYVDGDGSYQGFVAAEQNGEWGTATEVAGLGALNAGGDAGVNSVSCASAGSCVAGGAYADGGIAPPRPQGHLHGFVAVEQDGAWGTALEVPGLAALNAGGKNTFVTEVSCAPAGNCVAGGYYSGRSGHYQGFVASEDNGTWGATIEVPGLGALNAGGDAKVGSLSCSSPGNCAAGGFYTDRSGHRQGFVT